MGLYGVPGGAARPRPAASRMTKRRAPITAKAREEMAARARAFLCRRYHLGPVQSEALAAVPVVWARGRDHQRGRFSTGPGHGAPGAHVYVSVPRGETARRALYARRTAGLTTPPGGLEMPIRLALTLTLVHEYTHALQFGAVPGLDVRRGEVEPTKNEIAFLREQAPAWHARLVPVPPRTARRSARRAATRAEIQESVDAIVAWLRRRGGL